MSATDVLRRMLDERGVEWTYADGTVSFNDGERWFHAWAYNDGAMCVSMGYLTPEQAIAATLGKADARPTQAESSWTCHMVLREDIYGHAYQDTYECSECGDYVVRETYMGESEPPNYCPECGRKVVEPTTNDVDAVVDA